MQTQIKTGWEVEWCSVLPRLEDGDADIDRAEYEFRDFATKEKAIAFAEFIVGKDQFGSVRVTHFYSEPYEEGLPACFREYDSDPEYVDA